MMLKQQLNSVKILLTKITIPNSRLLPRDKGDMLTTGKSGTDSVEKSLYRFMTVRFIITFACVVKGQQISGGGGRGGALLEEQTAPTAIAIVATTTCSWSNVLCRAS